MRGSSGAILSGILIGEMIEYDIYIYHIKKDGEYSHSSDYYPIDFSNPNIIIDDFISSGETVNAIFEKIQKVNSKELKIDTLCVSGGFNIETLNFRPNNIISGK